MRTLVASAGDLSGDMYLSRILEELGALEEVKLIIGAGPVTERTVRALGENIKWMGNLTELSAAGLIEALTKIPTALRKYKEILNESLRVREARVKLALLVDFPAFNTRLASSLKRHGYKIIYFIPPRSWMKAPPTEFLTRLKELIDIAVLPFPWLEEPYNRAGIQAFYSGHPLIELMSELNLRALNFTSPRSKLKLMVLPGSRDAEVKRTLPIFLSAIRLMREDIEQVMISTTPNTKRLVSQILSAWRELSAELIEEVPPWRHIQRADLCWITSGTAALEAFLLAKRAVVAYRMSPFSATFVRLTERRIPKFVTLPNLILEEEVYPEVIQEALTPDNLLVASESILRASATSLNERREELLALLSPDSEGPIRRTALQLRDSLRR